jgi:hypothetical protein
MNGLLVSGLTAALLLSSAASGFAGEPVAAVTADEGTSGGAAATGTPTSGGAASTGDAATNGAATPAAPQSSIAPAGAAGPQASVLSDSNVLIGLGVGAAVVAGVAILASEGSNHSSPSTTGTH